MELDERWDCRVRVPRRSRKRVEASRYPYGFKRVYEGSGRVYFEARGLTREQRDDVLAKAREDKFVFNSAERSFRRSSDYRDRFLEANPGPWRCRYCNRPLADSGEMTVDHIVPADAVDPFGSYSEPRRAMARRALRRLGMSGVNDIANLAPCRPQRRPSPWRASPGPSGPWSSTPPEGGAETPPPRKGRDMEGIIGKEQGPADNARIARLMEVARRPIKDMPVHGVGLVTILPDGSKTVDGAPVRALRDAPSSDEA